MVTQHPMLLVEDSPEDREATMRTSRKPAWRIPFTAAATATKPSTTFFRRGEYANPSTAPRPNLILLDLNMPGTDGREVLAEIKKWESLHSIPVIVLTTSTDTRDIEGCYQMGANSYVKKPVDLEGFMRSVQRLKDYWFEVVILPKVE